MSSSEKNDNVTNILNISFSKLY